jgi:NTP pyrophosphatase (non-canonical NTP hydrolase)
MDELAELQEKFLLGSGSPKPHYQKSLTMELGDVSWYFFISCTHLQVSANWGLSNVIRNPQCLDNGQQLHAIADHLDYQLLKQEFSPNQNDVLGVGKHSDAFDFLCDLSLATVHAGKALGAVKKLHRGDRGDNIPDVETRLKIAFHLAKSFGYVLAWAHAMDIDPSEAAKKNLEKLASRKERGKLQGSGDNR